VPRAGGPGDDEDLHLLITNAMHRLTVNRAHAAHEMARCASVGR